MNAPQPADNQTYDFFVSYARGDNANGWITRFIEELLAEHQQFAAGRTLKQFFDQHAITTGADWQLYLAHGIAHSRLFLAFISPNYLASEWCRKEWRAWIDAEIAQHILTAGVRPIYIVEVPGLTGRGQLSDQQLTQKLAELSRLPERDRNKLVAETPALLKHLRRRQHTHNQPFCDIHAFYDAGLDALRREDLRLVLTELAHDLDHHAELLARADASLSTVPAYNRNFTGRLDELLALRERLIKDDRTGVIYGVHGLGGIGKTELALAYAHAYASAYPGGRFLIRCENKASLRDAMLSQSDFTALFRDKIGDEERKQPDTYFAAVLACLRERLATLGHVLLVLDNVSDCALLEPEQTDTVTALGPKLHLLATTRLVPPTTGRSNWLSLGRLPDDDALDLLEKFRPFATDAERDAARRIVKRLGGFTLTVELVAAWLAKHRGTTFAAFLQRPGFESLEAFDLLAEEKDVKLRRHNDERRLAAVLDPTLDALAPAERRAMEYAALLPPDHVALPWLRALVGKDFPEFGVPPSAGSGFGVPPSGGPPTSEVPPSGGETTEPPKGGTPNPSFSNDNWLLLLDHLTGLTLFIRPETETTEPRLMTVHRLVQDRVRSRMAAPDLATRQQAVNALVKERDAALEKTNLWEDARWELEPFGALADLWAEAKHPWATWLLNQAGFRWHTLAEWNPCETAFRRALAIDEQSFGPEHPNVAIDLNNLAQLLKATNRLAEAEPLMRRVISIFEKSLGEDHPNVATSLNNLATLLQDTNRLAEAELLMRRALAIDEQSFGPEHPNVARDLNNLAGLLQDTNRLAEAELLMRRALAIDEQSFGPDHPNVAIRLNNLANLLQDTNRLTEAEPLYRRALAIRESGLVPDHPDTFSSIQRLADVLEKLGKREECERLREQFADRVLHTATTVAPLTRRQLALHFYRRADHQRAEQLLRQLLEEGFEVPGTCCHLARIALMTDQIEDGRKHIARAWQERSQAAPYVVPRILWLQLALEMLEHGDPAPLIGRLKTALQNDGAFQEWTMEPVLEHLKGRMQQTEADRQNWELLRALVAALSDRVELPELGNFPAWREAQPEPLD